MRADLVARYNKDDAWTGRRDEFTRVSDYVEALVGARAGAAVNPAGLRSSRVHGRGELPDFGIDSKAKRTPAQKRAG